MGYHIRKDERVLMGYQGFYMHIYYNMYAIYKKNTFRKIY